MEIKKTFRTHVSTRANIPSRAVKLFLSFWYACFRVLRSLYKSLYSKIFPPTFSDVIQNFREDFSGKCKAPPKLNKLEVFVQKYYDIFPRKAKRSINVTGKAKRNIDVMRKKIDKFKDFVESHKEDFRTFLKNISQDFKTTVDLSSFIDQAPEETQISDSQISEDISFACEILYRIYSLIAAESLKSSYPFSTLQFSSEPYRRDFIHLKYELYRDREKDEATRCRIQDIVLYFISTPYRDDCFKNIPFSKEYFTFGATHDIERISPLDLKDFVESIPEFTRQFPVVITQDSNETDVTFQKRVLEMEKTQFMECLNIVDVLAKFPCGGEAFFIEDVILADYTRKEIEKMTNEISKPYCKIRNTENDYLMPVIFRASYCIFLNNMQASCRYFKMPQGLQNEISRRLKIVKNWELYLYKGPYPSMLAHSLAKTLQTGVIQKLELI